MSIIAVEDVAFVRFSAPDLDAMEEFLMEFGLARAARTAAEGVAVAPLDGPGGGQIVTLRDPSVGAFRRMGSEAAIAHRQKLVAALRAEGRTVERQKRP